MFIVEKGINQTIVDGLLEFIYLQLDEIGENISKHKTWQNNGGISSFKVRRQKVVMRINFPFSIELDCGQLVFVFSSTIKAKFDEKLKIKIDGGVVYDKGTTDMFGIINVQSILNIIALQIKQHRIFKDNK